MQIQDYEIEIIEDYFYRYTHNKKKMDIQQFGAAINKVKDDLAIELLVMQKIADLTKEIKKASQTGILITRNITELGSVHLNASLDRRFISLDVLQDILDSNFSE